MTLVLCLLASTIPTLSLASASPATSSSTVKAAAVAAHNATVALTPATATGLTPEGRSSLCILGVLPGCPIQASPSTTQAATALTTSSTDPPSSWTDITPPAGSPNPPPRYYPSMTYYPAGHDVLLFGGYGEPNNGPWVFYQDTWSYVRGRWTEVIDNATCTPSTCPAPRAGAMMTYYPPSQGVLLFGGFYYNSTYAVIGLDDTWLFANGHWTNLTATVGPAPSARFDGSMVWDSLDGYALLFGGAQNYGATYGDTWTFQGTWTNVTGTLTKAPESRAGAAISNSPSGYIMMFGGEDNGAYIEDVPGVNCPGTPQVAWWWYHGAWSVMTQTFVCVQRPVASTVSPNAALDPVVSQAPPCGRVDAALGWSPQNVRFVLYGGIGPLDETTCTGFDGFLNDTWTYQNPPGTSFYWQNAGDSGDPPAREQMGYASDFTDNYFEIFGGYAGQGALNETWRFFEFVHAKLSGPSLIDTAATFQFNTPFTVVGYGGTNNLSYSFSILPLRTSNHLQGTGCSPLTSGASFPFPYDGVDQVTCEPTQTSYNVYRLTALVVDNNNTADRATANWTFTVQPPETAVIYSQYVKYFYTNFGFNNVFSAELVVANQAAKSVAATLGGNPITFTQRQGQPFWWDTAPIDMGGVTPGATLHVSADFADWDLNATYQVKMIDTPAWLYTLFQFTGATQTVVPKGAGPFNKTYTIYENYSWDLGKAFGFSIPIPLAGGDYSLIPTVSVSMSATSKGNVSLKGSFSLDTPKIDLGVVSLKLDATMSMQGTFALDTQGPEITGITWLSAKAVVSVSGDFGASVPIYGFDILGIDIGFTLKIDLKPSVALNLILAPTTDTTKELINGIQVMVSELYGTFALPLSVSVSFGIGIASVSLGGKLEVDVNVGLIPTAGVVAGWVNGSIIASASALFWSDSWTLLGPATIYSWTDPPANQAAPVGLAPRVSYNSGSGTTWQLNSRYYATTGYDANVWSPSASQGTAISDIYPHAQIAGAAGYDGAYLFYSDDNVQVSLQQGLRISGVRLDPTTNRLVALPAPNDPGYVLDRPVATTLPDGSLYVVWAALPSSESSLASPLDLTSLELHGARFYPGNGTWGPVHRWVTTGIIQSYALDGSTPSGSLVALTAPSFLLGATTSEQMLTFNLATGAQVAATPVSGISEILSARSALGEATVQRLDGNDSLVNLTSGAAVPLSLTLPTNSTILSEAFVPGSASTLLLLVRAPESAEVVLYDVSTSQTLATAPVAVDAFQVRALQDGGVYYVFAATRSGIQGWKEAGGSFSNLTDVAQDGITSFQLVQAGSSLALFSLASSGNVSQPIVNLTIAEVGAALPAVPGSPAASSSTGGNDTLYIAVLGVVAAADAVMLALWFTRRRRERPPQGEQAKTPPSEPPLEPPASPPGG